MSRLDYSSDQITSLIRQAKDATLSGQLTTGLITTSASKSLEGGYDPYNHTGKLVPKPEWENVVPKPISGHDLREEMRAVARGEYPDNNPKTAFGAKKLPLELVPPSAVHALAEAFSDGAKKYGPYNWRDKTISSSIYYGAALRHLSSWWDGENIATDSGIHHLHHALACIAMLIDGASVGKLNDNRPTKGAAAEMQRKWLEKTA
jgi:hypothetical protein